MTRTLEVKISDDWQMSIKEKDDAAYKLEIYKAFIYNQRYWKMRHLLNEVSQAKTVTDMQLKMFTLHEELKLQDESWRKEALDIQANLIK